MSALAELFARRGVRVTGCDSGSDGAADLRRHGIEVQRGHDPMHAAGARALVVSSAVPKDHPELAHARSLGVPVIRRAEALGEVTAGAGRELVAVAGTHGKSTTTAMIAEALAAAGRDPTALVGARVASWNGNLRPGSDRVFVVEADEYDRSFLALTPTVAVVTNVEADHLDIYDDLQDIHRAFAQFIFGARGIVLCGDQAGAAGLPTPASSEVIRYGLTSPDARLFARGARAVGTGSAFVAEFDGERLGTVTLRVAGQHNILNALGALAAGFLLGAPFDGLARGLAAFAGTERRFQRLGDAKGVTVIDDYAHHPTEIRATIAAARTSFPGRRIVVAFQPHLFSRTRDFAADFAATLAEGDAIYLADIYPAREQPIAGVTSDMIVAGSSAAQAKLAWRGDRAHLAAALAAGVRYGDVVITMGAGDITKTGPELLATLGAAA